ncbi:hypothetical protein Scep_019643 [Stephania cephalantha]|uniref:Uncharacterized protein n=1 Tax=Stephania cephalantha TaxID=152367 RepID=A0AAP0IB59_9MAGN
MERVRDWRRKGWTAERGGGPATRKDDDGAPAHGGNSTGDTADAGCAAAAQWRGRSARRTDDNSSGCEARRWTAEAAVLQQRSRHRPPRRRLRRGEGWTVERLGLQAPGTAAGELDGSAWQADDGQQARGGGCAAGLSDCAAGRWRRGQRRARAAAGGGTGGGRRWCGSDDGASARQRRRLGSGNGAVKKAMALSDRSEA